MRLFHLSAIGMFSAMCLLQAGCDWSSSGTSFNTSQGAGVNVNFSGVYNGNINGKAVQRTSRGNITRLVINQNGNRVEVLDNQGSRYEGTVGSPGLISGGADDGTYPAGAELVQSQISFTGKDEVAQKEVEFVGIIHVVSVNDIQGKTTSKTTTSNDSSSSSKNSSSTDSDTRGYTTQITVSTNSSATTGSSSGATGGITVTTTERQYDPDGNLVYQVVTVETTEPGEATDVQQTVIVDNRSRTDTGSGTSTDSSNSSKSSSGSDSTARTTTETTTYQITEANTQYRLEGTWVEKDSSVVSRVDAISRGAQGSITTSSSAF